MGGCQMSNDQVTDPEEVAAEDLPDVPAFKDEFTRGFLTSIQETKDGFYPFLSGTGNYEMSLPEDGIVSERSYSIKGDYIETAYVEVEKDEVMIRIRFEYYGSEAYPDLDTSKLALEGSVGEKLDFQKESKENHTVFLSKYREGDSNKKGFAVIAKRENTESLWIRYKIELTEENTPEKEQIFNQESNYFHKWLETVKFTD